MDRAVAASAVPDPAAVGPCGTPGDPPAPVPAEALVPDAALAALLVLADGRFPSGGHAHSGGVEAAVHDGRVHDLADLAAFLDGRAATTGLADAALAAATAVVASPLGDGSSPCTPTALAALDAECRSRTPAPALWEASLRQGRQLWRAVARVWDGSAAAALAHHVAALAPGPPLPVAHGLAAVAAGLGPDAAAIVALHAGTMGPATAAVRLLGLDPYAVHGLVAGRAADLSALASEAVAAARRWASSGDGIDLPAGSGPLVDLAAEGHRRTEVRMFAS